MTFRTFSSTTIKAIPLRAENPECTCHGAPTSLFGNYVLTLLSNEAPQACLFSYNGPSDFCPFLTNDVHAEKQAFYSGLIAGYPHDKEKDEWSKFSRALQAWAQSVDADRSVEPPMGRRHHFGHPSPTDAWEILTKSASHG